MSKTLLENWDIKQFRGCWNSDVALQKSMSLINVVCREQLLYIYI